MSMNASSILVIDDDMKNLSLLFNLLNEAGFEVLVSRDGESAIKSAENAQPNLILLDVLMSGIDGFETCRRLKASEKTQHIPVIFMTGLTSTVNKVRGFELGAIDYLTKPVEPEEVLVRIKTHLTIQQLQQDLQTKNQELQASLEREQDLNTFKSRFMSIATHEFRNPLTTVLFSSNLLRRYSAKITSEQNMIKEMGEELDSIERSVRQMMITLDGVLKVSKSETERFKFQPTSVNIKKLCQYVIEKFSIKAAETHTIHFLDKLESPQAVVEPKLMEQILSNLLSNAIKYSPNGGTITCNLFQENGVLILSVKDEGIGISKEDQRRLFKAFQRGGNVNGIQGTGLGLSIVKQFVELHGGTIHVESEVDRETTFKVALPICDKPENAPSKSIDS